MFRALEWVRIGRSPKRNSRFLHDTGIGDSDGGGSPGLHDAVVGRGAGLSMVEESEYKDRKGDEKTGSNNAATLDTRESHLPDKVGLLSCNVQMTQGRSM